MLSAEHALLGAWGGACLGEWITSNGTQVISWQYPVESKNIR